MPVKSLSKVQKSVQKKKSAAKGLHVNSRDAKRLQRATLREEKVHKTQHVRAKQNQPYLDRVAFFQSSLENVNAPQQPSGVQEVVLSFINHRDEEIAEVQAQNRPGRPVSMREQLLLRLKKEWQQEYASGFWIPDSSSTEALDALKQWDGTWSSLSNLSFSRITPCGTITASDFPPRKA